MHLSKQYRPARFDQVLGQEDVVTIIQKQIHKGRLGPAYILYGPSGSGKTTIARLMAMTANCGHKRKDANPCGKCKSCTDILRGCSYDVIEFDIGSYRGIDSIKQMEMVTKFSPFVPGHKKVFIMDEVHALTSPAWDATLKMMEDSNPYMLFILCTTDVTKVPEAALSRCQEYALARLTNKAITAKLAVINKKERYDLDLNALRFIAEFSGGNMRRAEMALSQVINLDHGVPSPKMVRKFLQRRMM